jgi:hypothetical protein
MFLRTPPFLSKRRLYKMFRWRSDPQLKNHYFVFQLFAEMDDYSLLVAHAERDRTLEMLQQRKGLPTTDNLKEFRDFEHFLQEVDMSEKGVGNFTRELYEKYKDYIFINGSDANPRFTLQLRMESKATYFYYYFGFDGKFCFTVPSGMDNCKDETDAENRQYWHMYRFGVNEKDLVAEAKRLMDVEHPTPLDIVSWMRYYVMRRVYSRELLEECHEWYRKCNNFPKLYYDDFKDWQCARKADRKCIQTAKLWSFSGVERRQISFDVIRETFDKNLVEMGIFRANAASRGFYLDKEKGKIVCNWCAGEVLKDTPKPDHYHTTGCPYDLALRPRPEKYTWEEYMKAGNGIATIDCPPIKRLRIPDCPLQDLH